MSWVNSNSNSNSNFLTPKSKFKTSKTIVIKKHFFTEVSVKGCHSNWDILGQCRNMYYRHKKRKFHTHIGITNVYKKYERNYLCHANHESYILR